MTKKIYKNLTSVSQNVYTDKLHNIFDKSNSKYCRTIKMKSIDVKISTPTDFDVENNDKDNNFQVVNLVRASKHEKKFAQGYIPRRFPETIYEK